MTPELRFLNEVVAASTRATRADKQAASKMAFELRGEPFVYNAYLCLVARGVATTESNVKAEAKKIARADERHCAALSRRYAQEAESCL